MNASAFRTALRQKGYRITSQRLAVLQLISQSPQKHLSADEIFAQTRKRMPRIGIATIYKTLNMLEREGLLYKLEGPDKVSRYEMRGNQDIHAHLQCLRCGRIVDLSRPGLKDLLENLLAGIPFSVLKGNILLYGYCEECKAAEEKARGG